MLTTAVKKFQRKISLNKIYISLSSQHKTFKQVQKTWATFYALSFLELDNSVTIYCHFVKKQNCQARERENESE